ncbi:MAG: AmmeMemoRadiSam system protein A [Nitrospinota bacterium]|nr:AmmeMemoRadiSam system protein A [Nitrospinota bacterium]
MPPHPYVALAIKAVKHYLEYGEPLPCPKDLTEDLKEKTGAFVSIKKKKNLRGCIGTLTPVEPNLAGEIIRNAISAATQDPRFSPISKAEFADLIFFVDVLTPSEKVEGVKDLDAKKYGVILKGKGKQAVLLPDLEGIDTAEKQIEVCRKKAKLKKNEPVELFRFQVERFK